MTTIQHVLRVARRSGLRLAIGAGGVLPLALAAAPTAGAQGFGPDPFRPYNSQYDSAVFPIAPGPLSPLGASRFNQNAGPRGANQFENYLESLEGGRGSSRRYDQANRVYDRQFGRQYQPNREADAGLQERRAEVSDIYFRYLRETDPRKRAALLQEYKRARAQTTRDLTVGGRNARNSRAARSPARDRTLDEAPEIDERSELDPAPGASAARSPAARRPAARRDASEPPAARSGGAPPSGRSPSEILDRATRPDIPPAPALPRPGAGAPRDGGSSTPPPPPTQ